MGLESSCVGRQGQGYDCRNYVVSYQNKRFNTHRLASDFLQMTRLVKAFYSKGLIPHGGFGGES